MHITIQIIVRPFLYILHVEFNYTPLAYIEIDIKENLNAITVSLAWCEGRQSIFVFMHDQTFIFFVNSTFQCLNV